MKPVMWFEARGPPEDGKTEGGEMRHGAGRPRIRRQWVVKVKKASKWKGRKAREVGTNFPFPKHIKSNSMLGTPVATKSHDVLLGQGRVVPEDRTSLGPLDLFPNPECRC